jgi:hypothetical protein
VSTLESARKHVRSISPDAVNREKDDFYRTPPVATWGLLSVEKLSGVVWEPACGDGAISRVLEEAGLMVISTDLFDRGYGRPGKDFLLEEPRFGYNSIVMNPPFRDIKKFLQRATALGCKKTYMIGRLLFLEGKTKQALMREAGLARVWVFSKRINIARAGYVLDRDDGIGGMIAFAWYVFEQGYEGVPQLGWINVDEVLAWMRERGKL